MFGIQPMIWKNRQCVVYLVDPKNYRTFSDKDADDTELDIKGQIRQSTQPLVFSIEGSLPSKNYRLVSRKDSAQRGSLGVTFVSNTSWKPLMLLNFGCVSSKPK